MKFCPECGSKLLEGKKFCPECGFKIDSFQQNDTSSGSSNTGTDIAIPVVEDLPKKITLQISNVIPYKKFGLKTYTFIFAAIFLFHAAWITAGTPSFLWVVDLQTAANIAIGEYLLSMFIVVVLVFRLITHGYKRTVLKDGKPIVKRKIREI